MNDYNMGIFSSCTGCFEKESDVEFKDVDVTETPIPKHNPVEKYTTSIEFDKNHRKIETRLYNQDLFTPLGNKMISETFI